MSTGRMLLFALILCGYLVAGILYVTLTPPWQAPDEPAHFNYVRYLVTHTGFPELVAGCYDETYLTELKARRFPPELTITNVCYEYHQPPLFYLVGMPIFILSEGSLTTVRLFSLVLGAGVVILAFFIGQTIFPDRSAIALGTMAFVAFVPMHVAILASVNNDALSELILATILLILTRRLLLANSQTIQNDVLLGISLGLGLITKTTAYIAIPLTAIVLLLATGKRFEWPAMLKHALIIYGLGLLIALPWYIRNINLYGKFDFLGLGKHNEIVIGQLRTVDHIAVIGLYRYIRDFITITFNSFWGQFGWMAVPMDSRTYQLLAVILLIAVAGLIGFFVFPNNGLSRLSNPQKKALWLMAATIFLMVLAYIWYNLTFVQFQGRYLFPALIPFGLFFSVGLNEALSSRWAGTLPILLALTLAGTIIFNGLRGVLDKWIGLILGVALVLAGARLILPRFNKMIATGLFVAVYTGLALLTIMGPYWFVVPYL